MKYLIVIDENIVGLIQQVNAMMEKGWHPIGGVAWDRMNRCTQAMLLNIVVEPEPLPKIKARRKRKDAE